MSSSTLKKMTNNKLQNPNPEHSLEPVVSLEELLMGGSDDNFREFMVLLYAMSSRLQTLRRHIAKALSISAAEFGVLMAIAHLEKDSEVKIREIADHLHIAAAHVTAKVGLLEKQGLVSKTADSKDARAVSVQLTPAALDRLNQIAPSLRKINDTLFQGLSRGEFLIVSEFMCRFIDQHDTAPIYTPLRNFTI